MDTMRLVFDSAGRVLWAGLLLGAGLPVVFALGVRMLAGAEDTVGPDGTVLSHRPSSLQRIVAWICFALVVFGVVVGLLVIIGAGTGKVVSFEHGWPTLVPKS